MTNIDKIWICKVCEYKPIIKCRSCNNPISKLESENQKCNTCGAPLDNALYKCPSCESNDSIRLIKETVPDRNILASIGLKPLKLLRTLVGTIQMTSLIGFVMSCSVVESGGPLQESALSLATIRLLSFLLFASLIPIQIYLIKVIKNLTQ